MSVTVADKLKSAEAAINALKTTHWEIACEHDKWRDKWKELCDATGCTGHAAALEWIRSTREVSEGLKADLRAAEKDRDAVAKERDEAREMLRLFRSLFSPERLQDPDAYAFTPICRDYDAKYGDSAPPGAVVSSRCHGCGCYMIQDCLTCGASTCCGNCCRAELVEQIAVDDIETLSGPELAAAVAREAKK